MSLCRHRGQAELASFCREVSWRTRWLIKKIATSGVGFGEAEIQGRMRDLINKK